MLLDQKHLKFSAIHLGSSRNLFLVKEVGFCDRKHLALLENFLNDHPHISLVTMMLKKIKRLKL